MMPQCPAGGGSDDSEVTGDSPDSVDRRVGPCDVTGLEGTLLLQNTEHGTCSQPPEERSEGTGGGARNEERCLVQGTQRSPDRGEAQHQETQAADPQKRSCPLPSSPHVFPCSTQTAVVTPQPGVSQIVLNFRGQGDGLALDGVPLEAVSQCHGGCHMSQRVAKQIVLIFVNHPCESAKQACSRSCGGPACTVNTSTQTGGDMCHRTPVHLHSDRQEPPRSPHTFERSRSCGTQTEWDGIQQTPELSPLHVNISPTSHFVSHRTSSSTQTEHPHRVSECSSPPYHTRVISKEEEAPGLAFIRGQGMQTPSSQPAFCLGPADVLTSTRADRIRNCEYLIAPPLVLKTQEPPDSSLDCDRAQVSSCKTKVTNRSEDPTNSPSDIFTHNPFTSCKETQLMSEEPTRTATSDGPTAGIHGDPNHRPSSEESMESTTTAGQTAGIHWDPSHQESRETTTTSGQTAEIHGDPNHQPSSEVFVETSTTAGQPAEIHGDPNHQASNEESMEARTTDDHTAGIHDDLNHQPSSQESMESTTTEGIHGDLSHQASSEESMETRTTDGHTSGIHDAPNHQPSSEVSMETTTTTEQTSGRYNNLNQQPSSEESMGAITSDGQTAGRHDGHLLVTPLHVPSHPQTEKSKEYPGVPGKRSLDSGEEKPEITDKPSLKSLHRGDTRPEHPSCSSPSNHSQKTCTTSCLPPSLNKYLEDLLEQHRMSLNDPLHHQNSPSSPSPCSASHPHVRQVILNFLEEGNRPVIADVSSPGIASETSSSLSNLAANQNIPGTANDESPSLWSTAANQNIPGTASDESPSLWSTAANQNIPGTASDQSPSLSSKPVIQDVPSLGTSLILRTPGGQDVIKPGNSEDLPSSILTNQAGDQGVPKPRNRSDSSSSEQLTSRPLSQDVSSPGTARDAFSSLITSMVVSQDIPVCDPASDTSSLITSMPEYLDVPERGSTKNSPSTLLNKAALQNVPGLSTSSELLLSELSHKPENPDVAAPDPTSISSSALMKDKPVLQDVPGPQDVPSSAVLTSKPEPQDFCSSSSTSDPSLQMTSMPVTQDVSGPGTPSRLSDSSVLPSRPVTQDVSGPGTPSRLSDSSVLPSRPVTQDLLPAGPTRDSITSSPLVGNVRSSDTFAPAVPVGKDVPGSGTSSSVIRSPRQETQASDEILEEMRISRDRRQRPPQSHSCPAPLSGGVTSSVTPEGELRLSAAEPRDLAGPLRRSYGVNKKVTFEDIAVYFSEEEWAGLEGPQRALYCQVMMDNYRSLRSLGFLLDKPVLISRIEEEEAELWEDRGPLSRFSLHGAGPLPFGARCTAGVPSLDMDEETSGNVGGESARSSSHLGALMRLVNEIPGFLLGGSSPGPNLEDTENIWPCSEVKTEENSPSCTPASVYTQPVGETPESSSPGTPWGAEKSNPPGSAKAEEVEVPIQPPCRQSRPVRHPHLPHLHMKRELGACTAASPPTPLKVKQEDPSAGCGPAGIVPGKQSDVSSMKIRSSLLYKHPTPGSWECHPADSGREAVYRDRDNPGTPLPPSLSGRAFPRNSSVSPISPSDGSNTAALKDLHIRIKQEDSGSERDPADSPICGRKVPRSPMAPSPSVLEHLRLGASPRRSTMDRRSPHPQEIPHGKSHLHGLVNCLKEISASRLWVQPNAPPPGQCGAESDRSSADPSRAVRRAALDSSPSRVVSVLWRPPDEILKDDPYTANSSPNPFTVAVTNGSSRLKDVDGKMAESFRPKVAEPPAGSALIPGKCLDRVPTRPSGGQNLGSSGFHKAEEQHRAEFGMKRTHPDDPSHLVVGMTAAKRPNLESTSPSRVVGTLWIPPDDGKCPLMSVRNCVRKIPICWAPLPPVRGSPATSTVPDPGHIRTQGGGIPGKVVEVKEEKSPSPAPTPSRQWIAPPGSPGSFDQSGTPSTNVHLSGLMRLMEEIPVAESSNSSRTMYNIAIGHSMMKRPDRTNFLSYCNDDGSFQAELNDNTAASVDSVYSDDTSLSSENLDPSYSAIGGLQRVVSEFAELASVSPLVAVSVPPSLSAQEGHRGKEPAPASTPRLSDGVRGSQRGTPVSSASVCSAEDGEAAYAALCGLQKVVRGFNEQDCVSPFSAVRSTPNHGSLRESLSKKSFGPEEEEESPQLPDSSPVLSARFLYEGSWFSKADSSYSALSGLQKVVNGFSDLGCVSPFSAVSTSASESAIEICSRKKSEQLALDGSCSAVSGLKKVVNGVPDSCVSPATASSNPSSVGEPDPGVRRRYEQSEVRSDSARSYRPSNTAQKNPPRSSGQCIDLTQEEEPAGAKARTPNQDKQSIRRDLSGGRTPELSTVQAVKPLGGRVRPPASSQLIDLTEEEETPVRHRVPSTEAARKPHSVPPISASPHKTTSDRRKYRTSVTGARTQRVRADRPLEPGPSGAHRGGIPTVNEHISGLEKLLQGVPTFTPPNTPSGQRRSGSWWFKSTSPHET